MDSIEMNEAARELANTKTALYRHKDSAGVLLYVGISLNPFSRAKQHGRHSSWMAQVTNIKIEWFESRSIALDAEKNAIYKETPKHNIRLVTPPTLKGIKSITQKRSRQKLDLSIMRVEPVYTLDQVAEIFSIGKQFVKQWARDGLIGTVDVPYLWRDILKHKQRITGWQLLDFLELIQNEEVGIPGYE